MAIPLTICNSWFTTMNQLFSRFICANCRPGRALKLLTLPRDRGGWAVPNLQLYYWASMLQKMGILLNEKDDTMMLCYSVSIFELILGTEARGCLMRHIEFNYYKRVKFKTLICAFKVWTSVRKKLGLGRINAYTPIFKNNSLPNIFNDGHMRYWHDKGVRILGDITNEFELLLFDVIRDRFELDNGQFFKYLQIKDFISKKSEGGVVVLLG